MTQTAIIAVLLLLLSTVATAHPSPRSPSAEKNESNTHDVAEVQGCLQREQGQYVLVDKNNEYRRLSGNNGLKKLVGHEVKLTGKPAIRTIDTTPPGGASSAIEQHYFIVKTVQDVTPNCQSYGK